MAPVTSIFIVAPLCRAVSVVRTTFSLSTVTLPRFQWYCNLWKRFSVIVGHMSTETTLSPRERILRSTMELLARGGREAVTTRAVGNAAGVQSPTIYRQFGDMRGLLDEVADRDSRV